MKTQTLRDIIIKNQMQMGKGKNEKYAVKHTADNGTLYS